LFAVPPLVSQQSEEILARRFDILPRTALALDKHESLTVFRPRVIC
jgi:hypothetical protein